ncbi:HNH endonuclease [Paenibacillus sp. FSL R5-0345]|uniref:HNH endonuclease n=1 Tax=Paenibacillus sp. FSL R5-0345 TaxID=1536770 RepID=UPI000693B158|nr:HNH endonuclease [Paenibacillus sp. FSL R5-0345]
MNRINLVLLDDRLTEQFGIIIQSEFVNNSIEIRPQDLPRGNGFIIRGSLGWRNLSLEFIPDNFAGPLIRAMGLADQQKKVLFCSIASTIKPTTEDLNFRLNSIDQNPMDTSTWPNQWNKLNLKVIKIPVYSEEINPNELQELFEVLVAKILGMIVCLLPLEESVVEHSSIGLPEGAVTRVEVNRYERSVLNREACIMIHGCICKACGFDFHKYYGVMGQGFIHVHHVTPVSAIGPNYIVNPTTDLVPVCPNCHSMLHKRNPPFTVDDLKLIISKNT